MRSPKRANSKPAGIRNASQTQVISPERRKLNQTQVEDDEKNSEEKQEEKRKMEMLKKFFRNRH